MAFSGPKTGTHRMNRFRRKSNAYHFRPGLAGLLNDLPGRAHESMLFSCFFHLLNGQKSPSPESPAAGVIY